MFGGPRVHGEYERIEGLCTGISTEAPDLDGMRFSQSLRNALVSKPMLTQHKYAFNLAMFAINRGSCTLFSRRYGC